MSALFLCIFLFDYNVISFCFYTGVTRRCVSFVITSVLCTSFVSVVSLILDSFFSSCISSPFKSCYAVSLKWLVSPLCPVCLCWRPQPCFSFSCLLSALSYGLLNTHVSGYQAVHFLLHIQRCLNLPTLILRNYTGKQLLLGRIQKCYLNVLFLACAQPGLFVVENLHGTREQDTTLFRDILRQGTETVQNWAVAGSE